MVRHELEAAYGDGRGNLVAYIVDTAPAVVHTVGMTKTETTKSAARTAALNLKYGLHDGELAALRAAERNGRCVTVHADVTAGHLQSELRWVVGTDDGVSGGRYAAVTLSARDALALLRALREAGESAWLA